MPSRGLPILTPIVLVLCGLQAFALLALIGAQVYGLLTVNEPVFVEDELTVADLALLGTAAAFILVSFVCGIMFLVWLQGAMTNAQRLGATGLPISPGWAVGYFFVPILNLFKPHQAIQNLYQASTDPRNWSGVPASSFISVWWVLRVITWLSNNVSSRLQGLNEELAPEAIVLVEIGLNFATCFAFLMAIRVVWMIDQAQKSTYDAGTWQQPPSSGAVAPSYVEQPFKVVGESNNPYRSPRL